MDGTCLVCVVPCLDLCPADAAPLLGDAPVLLAGSALASSRGVPAWPLSGVRGLAPILRVADSGVASLLAVVLPGVFAAAAAAAVAIKLSLLTAAAGLGVVGSAASAGSAAAVSTGAAAAAGMASALVGTAAAVLSLLLLLAAGLGWWACGCGTA